MLAGVFVGAFAGAFAAGTAAPVSDSQIRDIISTFKASDPQHQQLCVDVMSGIANSSAQMGQDVFLWRNLFAAGAHAGRKGFYIESGANMPRSLSNTFFFDKCLGWGGLCIEPTPLYWADLTRERSCTLIKQCISDQNRTVVMSQSAVNSKVGSHYRSHKVQCMPLDAMMASVGQTEVDFWSLDVEGYEEVVLRVPGWELRTNVRVLLVEVDKVKSHKRFEALLEERGFVKVARIHGDDIYVNRAMLPMVPTTFHGLGANIKPFRFEYGEQLNG
jgi:FkbM family methyltransferase